jgi:hypothetical protein
MKQFRLVCRVGIINRHNSHAASTCDTPSVNFWLSIRNGEFSVPCTVHLIVNFRNARPLLLDYSYSSFSTFLLLPFPLSRTILDVFEPAISRTVIVRTNTYSFLSTTEVVSYT